MVTDSVMHKKTCLLIFVLAVGGYLNITAALSNEDAKFLWGRMKEALLNLRDFSRDIFITQCIESTDICPTSVIKITNDSQLQWSGNLSTEGQAHFWETYKCLRDRNPLHCPVDGHWGAWADWSDCSAECGKEGMVLRTRLCNNPIPEYNGFPCVGSDRQESQCSRKCTSEKYPAEMEEAKSYLDKIHAAYPELEQYCMDNHCTYEQIGHILPSNTKNRYWSSLRCFKYNSACPEDGDWSEWTNWSDCHPNCGVGKRYRFKNCTDPPPENDGLPCSGEFFEEQSCFGQKCTPENFLYGSYVSEWTPFGSCSQSCGKYGVQKRKRICLQLDKCSSVFKGKNEQSIVRPCYNGPCPRDGGWSDWSDYTQCSADCGSGRMTRIRLCNNPDPIGSSTCLGYAVSTSNCTGTCETETNKTQDKNRETEGGDYENISKLQDTVLSGDPYDYALDPSTEKLFTEWSSWTKCSKSCNVGDRERIRTCKQNNTTMCIGEVRQNQYCNVERCPVNGGWSEWLSWNPCSHTCDKGVQTRYRKCDNPLPMHGGTCIGNDEESQKCNMKKCSDNVGFGEWGAWSACTKSCGIGSRVRGRACDTRKMSFEVLKLLKIYTRDDAEVLCSEQRNTDNGVCNSKPCPVDGNWATWSDWSDCSQSCGSGYHFRDRSCTEPSPLYGGQICTGPGSETTPCFNGPCPDSRDHKSIYFNGESFLKYEPRHKPSRFLALYVLFSPEDGNGVLLHRKKMCRDCKHYVKLDLVDAKPGLYINHGNAELSIKANESLTKGQWHTISVFVEGNVGFIRTDDGKHYYGQYSEKMKEVNYDTYTTLGVDEKNKNGFKGTIADVTVNFKQLSLTKILGWNGYGVPFDKNLVVTKDLDQTLRYPQFRGNSYLKLELTDDKKLGTSISFKLEELNGVLLFNIGSTPDSYIFIDVVNGLLRFCFKCSTAKRICRNMETLQIHQWYIISLYINKNVAYIRLNNGRTVQLTSPGKIYRPRSPVFIGGGERQDQILLSVLTGHKKEFVGVIENVVINGETYSLRNKAIMNSLGYISSMGICKIPLVTQVYEHTDSIVTLRCDYSSDPAGDWDISVAWFRDDFHIKSGTEQKIIPKLPGLHNVSALVLSPSTHQEGIYSCALKTGGSITVTHAFVVSRNTRKLKGYEESETIWVSAVLAVVVLILLCACCVKCAYAMSGAGIKDSVDNKVKDAVSSGSIVSMKTWARRSGKFIIEKHKELKEKASKSKIQGQDDTVEPKEYDEEILDKDEDSIEEDPNKTQTESVSPEDENEISQIGMAAQSTDALPEPELRNSFVHQFIEGSRTGSRASVQSQQKHLIGERYSNLPIQHGASVASVPETDSPTIRHSSMTSRQLQRETDSSPSLQRSSITSGPLQRETDSLPTLQRSSITSRPLQRESDSLPSMQRSSITSRPLQREEDSAPTLQHSNITSRPLQRESDSSILQRSSMTSRPLQRETDSFTLQRSSMTSRPLQRETDSSTLQRSSMTSRPLQSRETDSFTLQRSSMTSKPSQRETDSATMQRSSMTRSPLQSSTSLPKPPTRWTSQQSRQSLQLSSQMSKSPLPAGSPSPPRNLPSLESTSRGNMYKSINENTDSQIRMSVRSIPPQVSQQTIGQIMKSDPSLHTDIPQHHVKPMEHVLGATSSMARPMPPKISQQTIVQRQKSELFSETDIPQHGVETTEEISGGTSSTDSTSDSVSSDDVKVNLNAKLSTQKALDDDFVNRVVVPPLQNIENLNVEQSETTTSEEDGDSTDNSQSTDKNGS